MNINNKIRVKNQGRGIQLEVLYNGKWYSTVLETKKQVPPPEKVVPKRLVSKKEKTVKSISQSNVLIEYGLWDADNRTQISLKSLVSLLITDTNKNYFNLPKGTACQMKVLVHYQRLNSQDLNLKVTLANGSGGADIQAITSNSAPKAMLLVSDGTYWHPIGDFTGGALDEWSAT